MKKIIALAPMALLFGGWSLFSSDPECGSQASQD
jgi:hypothetical protein